MSKIGGKVKIKYAVLLGIVLMVAIGLTGLSQAFSWLKNGVDARALAMGGAFVAIADNYSAAYWNPAGVARAKGPRFGAMHTNLFSSDILFTFISGIISLEKISVAGSFVNLSITGIPEIDGYGNQVGTIDDIETLLMGTAAIDLGALGVFVGGSVKSYSQSLAEERASGLGFDIGVIANVAPNFSVGVAAFDLGGTRINWTTGSIDIVEALFKAGIAFTFPEVGLTIAADLAWGHSVHFGSELKLGIIRLRGGVLGGNFTAGAGINWEGGSLDIAFLSSTLGNSLVFSGELALVIPEVPSKPKLPVSPPIATTNKPPVVNILKAVPTVDPLIWTFEVSATDPDGDIASYHWDFGDGAAAEGVSVGHTYAAPGTYQVCVEVRDRQNLTNKACKSITVERPSPAGNRPPRADFRWSPPLPEGGQSVQFTSDSTDAEGALASLEWDFGDGTRQTTTAQTISHTFAKVGTYRVCLTVKDAGGLSDTTCKDVKVAQRWVAPSNEKTRFFMSVISRDNNRQPSWSPDGKFIMFTSDRDMDWELYSINLDTQAVSRVTKSPGPDFDPSWCRDGKVVFVSDRDGQTGVDLYILDVTTGGVTRLTHDPAFLNVAPTCTPDGRAVIFTTNRDGDFEIYSIATETRAVNRITFSPVQDWNPQVSPDGKSIVFQSQVQGNSEIFVMDITGRNLRRLTFNPGEDVDPAWSPDGKKIAFASNRDGNFKIYVIDATGENEVVLTPDTNNNLHPVWSPDGRRIAFESDRTRNWEIWIIDADGKNLKRITGVSK
jgi:Tol biopolymer transport system component